MIVKIVNKSNNKLPEYATSMSAGFDLRANLEESVTLKARPLRGRTCASYPGSRAINKPVPTNILSPAFKVTGPVRFALKSNPALILVAYSGRAFLLALITLTVIS